MNTPEKPTQQQATSSKPRTIPPPPPLSSTATRPLSTTERKAESEKVNLARAALEKTSYFRLAFANIYNLSLLGGALTLSLLTQNLLLGISALGLEALWLTYAPDSKWMRRLVWDPALARRRREIEEMGRQSRLAALDPPERTRVISLTLLQEQIRSLASQNPSFTGDLLRGEIGKTDRLVEAFVDMALNCTRYQSYLVSIDVKELERDRDRYQRLVQSGTDEDPQVAIARKNLEIITKRLSKVEEICKYLSVARGQLDLIENSFQLIADQIVTMQSPRELSGQLDELLDGVEAIRETARDTEKILGTLDREL